MDRRSSVLGAAVLAALAAGCRRAPAAAPDASASVPALSAPAPAVASPLAAGSSTYTNEMQAENLRSQAAELGIRKLGKPAGPGGDGEEEAHPLVTYEEGLERTRETSRELEAERHAIDRAEKSKIVDLPGSTAGLVPGAKKEGAPVEDAPEDAGPKDPPKE